MKIFGKCFHKWVKREAWGTDPELQGGKYLICIYRRCSNCGKWQKKLVYRDDSRWEDVKVWR